MKVVVRMWLVVLNHVVMKMVPHVIVLAVRRLEIGYLLLLLTIYPITALVTIIDKSYSQLGSIIVHNR
jgi:hypothetical protein